MSILLGEMVCNVIFVFFFNCILGKLDLYGVGIYKIGTAIFIIFVGENHFCCNSLFIAVGGIIF